MYVSIYIQKYVSMTSYPYTYKTNRNERCCRKHVAHKQYVCVWNEAIIGWWMGWRVITSLCVLVSLSDDYFVGSFLLLCVYDVMLYTVYYRENKMMRKNIVIHIELFYVNFQLDNRKKLVKFFVYNSNL